MIRHNDSSFGYPTKLIAKINWHISEKAVYNYTKTFWNTNGHMIRNTKKLNRKNWGNRMIGIHYSDGTSRYTKKECTERDALKAIKKTMGKKGVPVRDWIINGRVHFKTAQDLKDNYTAIQNIAHKYGFRVVVNWRHIDNFPYVSVKKEFTVYNYPYM